MTRQADFKRRVRARMAKTGESYATARSMLLGGRDGAPAGRLTPERLAAALHVSNGDATDLPGTGLARRIVYWRDVLHDGPVPAVGPERLRRIRAAFLAGAHAVDRDQVLRDLAERDRTLDEGRDGEYVLWFEADLYDQLQIIQILARLARLRVPAERIHLICIGEHPGIARFGGLGELTPDELRELPASNACAPLTPDALDLAVRAWAAFRSPAPDGLRHIAATRSAELRFLGEAFDRLCREYPSVRDGLSLTERRVLAAVADGATDAAAAFARAASREIRPFLGDTSCYAIIDRLATAEVPLLRLDPPGRSQGEDTSGDAPGVPGRSIPPGRPCGPDTGVSLTDAGARVLAGRADHVTLSGVDRWIGGVHLRGRHVPWRWDDATETLVRVGAPG
jgi:hypothetical protein